MPRTKPTRDPLGSIIPRKLVIDGKKVARYDARKRYVKPDGRPGEKFKRCKSHAEAQIALTNFAREIEREKAGEHNPKIHTLKELTAYFEKHYIKPATFLGEEKESGYRQNLSGLRTYLRLYENHFGDVDLESITYEDLRQFRSKMLATPKILKDGTAKLPAPTTINRKLALLRKVFNVGVKRLRWMKSNPFNDDAEPLIKTDSERKRARTRVLSYEEEKRLLAACTGRKQHLRTAIIAAIETGMRKRELFTLKVKQIDFPTGVIRLDALQTKALTKRDIPVSSRLSTELQSHITSKGLEPNDLIFQGAKDFDTSFNNALRSADIKDFRWHDLRHTGATLMDAAGISEAARMNAIGHSTKKIAQQYVNSSPDLIEDATNKMDEFRRKLEERRKREAA